MTFVVFLYFVLICLCPSGPLYATAGGLSPPMRAPELPQRGHQGGGPPVADGVAWAWRAPPGGLRPPGFLSADRGPRCYWGSEFSHWSSILGNPDTPPSRGMEFWRRFAALVRTRPSAAVPGWVLPKRASAVWQSPQTSGRPLMRIRVEGPRSFAKRVERVQTHKTRRNPRGPCRKRGRKWSIGCHVATTQFSYWL